MCMYFPVCLGLIPVSVPYMVDVCLCDGLAGEIVIGLGGLLIRRACGSRDVPNGGQSKHSLLGNAAVVEQGNADLSIYRTIKEKHLKKKQQKNKANIY